MFILYLNTSDMFEDDVTGSDIKYIYQARMLETLNPIWWCYLERLEGESQLKEVGPYEAGCDARPYFISSQLLDLS